MLAERARRFVTDAPTSAAEAATIILDGVKADRLRILVGPDAQVIDEWSGRILNTPMNRNSSRALPTQAGWYPGR